MTENNEKRVDIIIDALLTQFETMSEEMSFTSQLELAQTILALEQAKGAGNPQVMNWGTVNVHQALDNGEIANTYTNGGKSNGN